MLVGEGVPDPDGDVDRIADVEAVGLGVERGEGVPEALAVAAWLVLCDWLGDRLCVGLRDWLPVAPCDGLVV